MVDKPCRYPTKTFMIHDSHLWDKKDVYLIVYVCAAKCKSTRDRDEEVKAEREEGAKRRR